MLSGAAVLALTSAPLFAGPDDNSLVIAMPDALEAIDFYVHQQSAIRVLQPLVEESLFNVDPQTNEILPALAAGYTQVDPLTIDVTLREGVTFHDGSPLTADDVVYSFDAGMRPEMSATTLQQRVGPWLASVEKTGDMSVRLHLKVPYAFALLDVANHWVIRKVGTLPEDGTPQTDIIGLGPYRIVSWDGQDTVLEPYEGYYADSPKGPATFDRIRIRTIPDWGTVQAELFSGGIDLALRVPADVAQNLATMPQLSHTPASTQGVYFVGFNPAEEIDGTPNPLSSQQVRQGINHAINKDLLIETLYAGAPERLDTPCSPTQLGCPTDVTVYEYDPDRARALFAEAGYPDGFPLDVWAGRERELVEAVSADLMNVGIAVNLRYSNMATVEAARNEARIPVLVNTWGNTLNADTWATLINYFGAKSDRSMVKNDPVLEDLIHAIPETTSFEEREAASFAAMNHIIEQAYWVPLMTMTVNYVTDARLNFDPAGDQLMLNRASWQ